MFEYTPRRTWTNLWRWTQTGLNTGLHDNTADSALPLGSFALFYHLHTHMHTDTHLHLTTAYSAAVCVCVCVCVCDSVVDWGLTTLKPE